ncbi:TPA: colanic acid undecaprenyl disphosphate flippase WzxC [Salmonella enterica]|uniref:Colanic acid undecaprenyl disphosphate flippase WzxC n=1 Tax=Salmonella enterica TaxID=28901 RepID=A0A8E9U2C1_SALER|nr:colanic acid exporter [Salmonella enterica]EBS0278526.1 colanic acid exporter [Salmonella enterica subsp. enterica serovar Waycross]ECC9660391.1 colanic acid exporter [Salmonella enterica subsp. enterica]EDW1900857.1 MOP flippase family protein [Salmonella enterica subsp. enterica serovar Lingwala]EDW8796637.1 MOP flippase family protein [Salmonella enterica subsp. enterica serovar Nyanza]EEL9725708.1 MOP flippase family protein [Salmonella enterica subsp. enterica serovar Infantis]HCM3118
MSLRQKTISGAKWSAIATIVIIGLGLIQMTVLARIIDNHQFGLLTVSLVIIALADTISDFGIANSIIQRKTIGHLELTTLYWLNVGLGIVVFAVVFWLSDAIAHVLHNPDLEPLIKTLSLAFIVIPHGQQFRALMQKELEFNKIGMIETTSVLAGFTFTVISAHYWPLALTAILGYLVNSAVRTLLFGYFGRKIYRPGLHFSLASVSTNLRFGAWLTADSIVNYINTNLSTLVLARILGASVAGGYNLAYNVAVVPPAKLNPIITRVLFPAFAKIQDDTEKLRVNFYKLLSVVGIINFPALLGLMVVANNFVPLVFGEKWNSIIPILQLLCVVGLLRSVGNPIGSLLMAKARVDISFKFNVFKTFLFIPAILIGGHLAGAIGVTLGFLVVQIINTILSYFVMIKPVLGSSYRQYILSLWLPFYLSLPTFITSYGAGKLVDGYLPLSGVFALQVVVGILSFILMIIFSRNALVMEIKNQLVGSAKMKKLLRVG